MWHSLDAGALLAGTGAIYIGSWAAAQNVALGGGAFSIVTAGFGATSGVVHMSSTSGWNAIMSWTISSAGSF